MASTWLIEWRIRSSWGLSLVFGNTMEAAALAAAGLEAGGTGEGGADVIKGTC
jgi:hypothetical protein